MIRVAFLVNGTYHSAMGHRARDFGVRLGPRYDIRIAYRSGRKVLSLFRFAAFLARVRPAFSYVFDMSYSGVLAGAVYKGLARNHLLIETGDAIAELARSMGRGWLGQWLTSCLEKFSFRVADQIVVRSRCHQVCLAREGIRAAVIQDGVDTDLFAPLPVDDLRRQYGLDLVLTVGLVGRSVWSPKLQMCYGWDLVELIGLLKHLPVKGVMIGDGSGIAYLKARCLEHGIEDRILFLGYVPYEQLPRYLNLIDVCLSTQTNDPVGQVRTTGKLPLYLATGRFVLASKVGEAASVLDREMLVEYEGVKDLHYPQKLAERIMPFLGHPERLKHSPQSVLAAKANFDYAILAARMAEVIEATRKSKRTGPEPCSG